MWQQNRRIYAELANIKKDIFDNCSLREHILLNFEKKLMIFSGHVQKVKMQGSVSQICYSCPSLNFINCRKSFMKKIDKPSCFLS